MSDAYSTYEAKAKAKANEVMRKVRRGQSSTVTNHGVPVAEIAPIAQDAEGFAARVARLETSGDILPSTGDFANFKPVGRKPGASQRFLDDRG